MMTAPPPPPHTTTNPTLTPPYNHQQQMMMMTATASPPPPPPLSGNHQAHHVNQHQQQQPHYHHHHHHQKQQQQQQQHVQVMNAPPPYSSTTPPPLPTNFAAIFQHLQYQQQQLQHQFERDYVLVDRLRSGSFGTVFTTYHKSSSSSSQQGQGPRVVVTRPRAATEPLVVVQHHYHHDEVAGHDNNNNNDNDASSSALLYAVKIIDRTKFKTQKDHDSILKEVCILNELRQNHLTNVIQLIDFYITSTKFYVITNYVKGGDVFERISLRQSYTEKDARDFARILFNVLQTLHTKFRICHRDLKPENILLKHPLDNSSLVVADFGFATHIPKNTTDNSEGYLSTRCGTPAYVAPEIVVGRLYKYEVDMWSVGCILYMILCGYPPFQAPSLLGLYRKIRAADYSFYQHHWSNVSIHAKRLISQLLTVDPTFRLSATQALATSSWLQVDDENLSSRDLSLSLGEIKKQVTARRKLKSAMKAILFSVHNKTVVKQQRGGGAAAEQYDEPFRFDNVGELQQDALMRDAEQLQPTNTYDEELEEEDVDREGDDVFTTTLHQLPPVISSTLIGGGGGQQQQLQDQLEAQQLAKEEAIKKKRFSLYNINPLPFDQVYTLGDKIHSGSFAVVYQCTHIQSGELLAVKCIRRKSQQQQQTPQQNQQQQQHMTALDSDENVLHEVGIMNSLDHPNIVSVVDFFETIEYYYIVMEYMAGGDVFDRITAQRNYTEKDARDLFVSLLRGVQHMVRIIMKLYNGMCVSVRESVSCSVTGGHLNQNSNAFFCIGGTSMGLYSMNVGLPIET